MLRDELLQSKHDEIARCVSSRKRKLSELYFATVGFPGATDGSPQHLQYQQREQEFLDANDITKGRLFNEGTLPRRPDVAPLQVSPRDDKLNQGSLSASAADRITDSHRRKPIFSPVRIAVSSPKLPSTGTYTETGSQDIFRPQDHTPTGTTESVAVQASSGELDIPQITPSASHDAIREKEVSSPASTQQTIAATVTPVTDVDMDEAPGGQDNTGTTEVPAPESDLPISSRKTVAEIQDNATGASLPTSDAPERQHGKRSGNDLPCLATDASPKSTDQPLSPASSRGQLSSTTSVSDRTPATSPAKEQPQREPQNESTTPPNSGRSIPVPMVTADISTIRRAPATPDEQLKFEAEQSSIQQAASKPTKNAPYTGSAFSSFQLTPENSFSSPKKPPDSHNEPDLSKSSKTSVAPENRPLVNGALRLDTEGVKPEPVSKSHEPQSAPVTLGLPEGAGGSPLPSATRKTSTSSAPTQPHFQPERMTTRVSSGAIRHRSVSEILGETPKSAMDKTFDKAVSESPTPTSENSQVRSRPKNKRENQKERSKLSTVVFPKQQSAAEKNESADLVRTPSGHTRSLNEEKDYLFTLFQAKAHYPPRSMHLSSLLSTAHKTLTTANHFVEYQEQMDCRSLKRIYQLQHANRWPLRQLQRSAEPERSGTHWDVLLDHMKWMRTDFREERKWKIAAAKRCADWCAEYVSSSDGRRAELRIPARVPPATSKIEESGNNKTTPSYSDDRVDDSLPHSQPTPDLISSMEDDSVSEGFNDEVHPDLSDGVVPAAIFSLGSDEFTFGMERTPAFEKILEELPLYIPINISSETNLPQFKRPPDSSWRKELLAVSKYATGKLEFTSKQPPRKRSRYDYSDNDDDVDVDAIEIPPEQTNVALFQPQNKHIRDRIHPGQVFRPPTEFLMPSLGFYESRQPSQWTCAEEDELKRIVKEYSFNWSLISACLTPPSLYTSGADRRTPWECFEKWVQLEGLPTEMLKTPYFRAYTSRVESAQRAVLAAQQQQQQQAQAQVQAQAQANPQRQGSNPPPTPTAILRRRPTTPMRVERKRSVRHLTLLDCMRKLSKKRETLLQKQQHATHLAASRKLNEVNQPRPPISTPAEFSRLKHERELKIQENQEQYKQAMIAQRMAMAHRVAQQQQAQHQQQQQQLQQQQQHRQMPNQQALLNGIPPRNTASAPPNGVMQGIPAPSGLPNGLPVSAALAQSRPHPGMQLPTGAQVNGMPNPGMGLKMIPQPGIPQAMNGRPGIQTQASSDNARIIREASRVQEEQQRMVQSRQQQLQNQQQSFIPQGPHSSPNMSMGNMNVNPNNPAMLTFQAVSGVNSPSFHASSLAQGVSTASPRLNHANVLANAAAGLPTLVSIQNTIRRTNPNMSQEQITKLATERLQHIQQQRMSQAAMNAAAGNTMGSMQTSYQMHHDGNMHQLSHANVPNGGVPASMQTLQQTQGYSPLMRVTQTVQQPNRMGVNGSPAMNAAMAVQQGRSATAQAHRSTGGQGGHGPGPVPGPGPSPGGVSGSGQGSGVGPGPGKSPRPPQAQMASS
ncbi:hypothetical protein RJZ56_000359 [Blastomyces dermatitidis]|uniref:Vacuolar import and degradation protein 21 n=2 Tax=Ajellomyces dermatitidis TaxID=5039 RepID=F2T2V4_AJEDA|nr:MYB and HSA domain-containing protein [Blastomyces dermatitidis ER-3]EEQ88619.2 MYB and HSA domain-containing protein [Blastomyces dermatitidis ER-3]EGE77214.1 MYB and HSA domain-containing protein [Blastomyces dermatitidis ATCC 18188]EQL38716.1 hypothetical protein BDFG_00263 [Blastomyces dermatitidis ATCC 26199]